MDGCAAVASTPAFTAQQSHHSAEISANQHSAAVANRSAQGQTMPLSFLKFGECASVVKVRGGGDLHHHLENLGFVEGALVKVINSVGGDLIVDVKGAQVALSRQIAQKIVAVPAA